VKYSNFAFRFIVCLLSISIFFTGCHSYYTIPKEDYSDIKNMEEIKFVYTNGKEFEVEKNDTTNFKMLEDSFVVSKGEEMKFIPLSEIAKIKENRFDLGGTITVIIIPLIILVAFTFAISSINL
jgi:hypothetical protein